MLVKLRNAVHCTRRAGEFVLAIKTLREASLQTLTAPSDSLIGGRVLSDELMATSLPFLLQKI